mgnify:CR=1 FL=1
MIRVGIEGEVAESFIRQMCRRYRDEGYSVYVFCGSGSVSDISHSIEEAEKLGRDVFIAMADSRGIIRFDIMIFNNIEAEKTVSKINNIKPDGYAIINADDCTVFPYILPDNINVITCGVNSRAVVTFSAINEYRNGKETIQCCVQKAIKTISGKYIEPQEFGVNVMGNYPLSEVLIIITAAIAADMAESVAEGLLFS